MPTPLRMWIAVLASLSVLTTLPVLVARPTFRADPDYLIDTWETEDGLPENSATAMVQSPDGYLWFGTFNGLVRFDGVMCSVFSPANTPELPSAAIVNLHQDRSGRLWVSTDRGLVVREGPRWRRFGTDAGWAGNHVRTFAERANGDLLMTTFDGHVLEFVQGRLSELPAPPGAPGQGYFAHVDEAGGWWVVQNRFVGRWDGQRWVETVRLTEPVAEAVGCATAPDGSLLLLANRELRRYRRGVQVERSPVEGVGSIWSVTGDSGGNVWIASYDQGLSRIEPGGGVKRWTVGGGLSYHSTRFVFEDREQNLWVGTSGGGLMRFKPRRFQAFDQESGLTERLVKSVWPDPSGGVWIGSFGQGLFHLGTNGITHVALPDCDTSVVYVQNVLRDRAGRVWVGTLGHGVWLIDGPVSRRIPPAQTGGVTVGALFEDSRGRVWIGGDRGLAVFESGAFRVLDQEGERQTGGVVCFGEDRKGALWFSNLAAVLRREESRLVEILAPDGQPLREVLCVLPEPDGIVWMGTSHDGLWRWRDGRLDRIGSAAGLPIQGVNAIIEDGLGYFWMPSNRGIVRAAQKALHAVADGPTHRLDSQLLDRSDGLPSAVCATGQPTCARDETGRLWFATQKGMAMIDPAGFRPNALPPPVYVEQLTYHEPGARARRGSPATSHPSEDEGVRLQAPFAERVRLPAGTHRLELDYTALGYNAPEKIRFQTMLEGISFEWEDAADRRVARFNELRPGPYRFRVRAANNDGVWNEQGASLAFTIEPYLWQTPGFKVLGLVALAAAIYVSVHRRVSRLQKERAKQQSFTRQLILSQEKERKRVAADLHDGLGQDLLLVKNRLAMAASRQADPAELKHQLDAATAATTRAIGEVRAISHALRPPALDQVGLTKAIEWMIEQLSEGSPTKFSAELEDIDGLLAPEMEMNLFRIVQEALNNAVRHAEPRQVILEVKREGASLLISLFDDGHGFDVEKLRHDTGPRAGMGLASMGERVSYLDGNLTIQSAPGRGTRLTVRILLPPTKT